MTLLVVVVVVVDVETRAMDLCLFNKNQHYYLFPGCSVAVYAPTSLSDVKQLCELVGFYFQHTGHKEEV